MCVPFYHTIRLLIPAEAVIRSLPKEQCGDRREKEEDIGKNIGKSGFLYSMHFPLYFV